MSEPACPSCKGKMWDNRLTKKNPKAPDYKCRDKSCDGVIWPDAKPKGNIAATVRQEAAKVLDLEEYGEPLPGKSEGPHKLNPVGTGSSKGDTSAIDELFHIYAACWAEAATYSTLAAPQAEIANSLFAAAVRKRNPAPRE